MVEIRRTKNPFAGGGSSSQNVPGLGALLGFVLGQQNAGNIGQRATNVKDQIDEAFPDGAPPGTQINVGKETTAKIPINREFTIEEVRSLGMSDAFKAHVKSIQSQQANPEKFRETFGAATFRLPGGEKIGQVGPFSTSFGNKDAQLMKFRLKDMSDRLLRLRSGAQINEQEFLRLTGLLPTFEDISDPSDVNFDVVNTKLNTFLQEMDATRQRILSGQAFDDDGNAVVYNEGYWGPSGNPINQAVSGGVNVPTKIEVMRNGVAGELDSMDEFDPTTDRLVE